MNPADILIVTSDTHFANDLCERLSQLGYRIVGVSEGDERAFTRIEELKPTLILTDIRLTYTRGGITTWELIHSTYNIPIIYITAGADQDTVPLQRAKTAAPSGFIFTPSDDWQFQATIETVLKRHQLESQVRESRKWLNTTLTSIGEGVIATDRQGLVQFINPAALELIGKSHNDALGKPLEEILILAEEESAKEADAPRLPVWSLLESRNEFEGSLLSRHRDPIPIGARVTPITDDHGGALGTVLVFRDLTRQKEAISEIRRQARRAEALVRAASQLNRQIELDKVLDKICVITNQALRARATGLFLLDPKKSAFRMRASFTDSLDLQNVGPTDFEIPAHLFENLLSPEKPVVVVADVQAHPDWPYAVFTKDQDLNTLVLAALFRRDQLIGALVSVIVEGQQAIPSDDITLLRGLTDQASNAIENAELFEQVRTGREHQRKLAKSLVDIQEAERRHIAQDLHDHLGQVLTGLQFMLESVKTQVEDKQKGELGEIQKTVSDVIQQVREMSLNLRPSMLDDLGLIPTLQWHFTRYTSQTGIRVNFQHDEFTRRMPPEIETTAYRIVQEALTNVARYAQVKEVFIGIALHEDSIWMEIVDKGRGFDAARVVERPSSGLGGMRERASLAGGFLVVESYINQGTQIVAALPLSGKPIERRKNDRKNPAGR